MKYKEENKNDKFKQNWDHGQSDKTLHFFLIQPLQIVKFFAWLLLLGDLLVIVSWIFWLENVLYKRPKVVTHQKTDSFLLLSSQPLHKRVISIGG